MCTGLFLDIRGFSCTYGSSRRLRVRRNGVFVRPPNKAVLDLGVQDGLGVFVGEKCLEGTLKMQYGLNILNSYVEDILIF